jgi:hypothetical protein
MKINKILEKMYWANTPHAETMTETEKATKFVFKTIIPTIMTSADDSLEWCVAVPLRENPIEIIKVLDELGLIGEYNEYNNILNVYY